MSKSRGGQVITTLPVSEETTKRRSDVLVDLTNVYTLLGYEIKYGSATFPKNEEHNRRALAYVSETLPRLVEGWKAGEGAPKFKTQRLRKLEGLERASLTLSSILFNCSRPLKGYTKAWKSCRRVHTVARRSCIPSNEVVYDRYYRCAQM